MSDPVCCFCAATLVGKWVWIADGRGACLACVKERGAEVVMEANPNRR